MKVVITGGAGFIGRHIVECFQDEASVYVIDNFRSGSRENLRGLRCNVVDGSILDRSLVRKALREVDYVFHLAALTSVPESVEKPIECAEINSRGTLIVLEEAAQAGAKKLVFSSSAAVYGDNPTIPKTETVPPAPKSPYAATKLEGENYCSKFTESGRLQTVCLRYFNVFGPNQDPSSQYAAAVPIFIRRALESRPLVIFGDGEQTRDFIYVKDVAAANAFFATQSSATGIFNVACGHAVTIRELAEQIRTCTNSASEIVYQDERPGDVRHSVAGIDKLLGAGFQPRRNFSDGLGATIAFFTMKATAGLP